MKRALLVGSVTQWGPSRARRSVTWLRRKDCVWLQYRCLFRWYRIYQHARVVMVRCCLSGEYSRHQNAAVFRFKLKIGIVTLRLKRSGLAKDAPKFPLRKFCSLIDLCNPPADTSGYSGTHSCLFAANNPVFRIYRRVVLLYFRI